MDLGKPVRVVVVPEPVRTPAEPPIPVEGWPIPLPAEWPVRRAEETPLAPVAPARPAQRPRHA